MDDDLDDEDEDDPDDAWWHSLLPLVLDPPESLLCHCGRSWPKGASVMTIDFERMARTWGGFGAPLVSSQIFVRRGCAPGENDILVKPTCRAEN